MEIVCSLQDQKVTLQPENTTFRSTWRASFMPSRSSIITIFSHFPCCFYFSFLRVIISEHHRIKAHNFCSGFCLRFCCSLPWPGWQSQLSKEEFTSKMVHSQLFLEYPNMQKYCLLFKGVSSTEGGEPEIVLTLLIWAQSGQWRPWLPSRPTQRQPSNWPQIQKQKNNKVWT